MRFVALVGGLALLIGGFAAWAAFLRTTPVFDGATDPAHVAAVKALIVSLPAPEGTTPDPYGTWCGGPSAACWTSTTVTPRALVSALTDTLAAKGGKVRSHDCSKPESAPVQAPEGSCAATVDYHGSRIDVVASSRGKLDNAGRDFVRLDSSRVTPTSSWSSDSAPALPPWTSVNLLPAAWTTGVTCTKAVRTDGCRGYSQRAAASPVVALPRAQVCATVVARLRGQYFIDMDEDLQRVTSEPFCRIVAHRFRSPGDRDGEAVFVVATSITGDTTRLSVDFHSE